MFLFILIYLNFCKSKFNFDLIILYRKKRAQANKYKLDFYEIEKDGIGKGSCVDCRNDAHGQLGWFDLWYKQIRYRYRRLTCLQRRHGRGFARNTHQALSESHGLITYHQDRVRGCISVHFDRLEQAIGIIVKFKFFAADLIINRGRRSGCERWK